MKYCCRYIQDRLEGDVSLNKIRIVFGARQTGKTVLMKKILPEKNSLVFNLQDSSLRQQFERDPSLLRKELAALSAGVTHIGIDEIQKVPALLNELQFIYDEDKTRFQFFITGSSARKLLQHSANLLPGRSHVFHLFPVSLPEVETYKGVSTGNTFQAKTMHPPFPGLSLERNLLFGNLPVSRFENEKTAQATLDSYVKTYLEEEIRSESLVRNVGAFHVFLRLAAIESGAQVNLSGLSQESGIPLSSLKNYYQILVDTFIGFWLYPYKHSGRKRLLTSPRFYFFDSGVRNAAAEISADRNILNELGGKLLEEWVGIELYQRAQYSGRGFGVGFWRTVSGAEVDFVWQSPEEDIPIEVKWTENPSPKDARHLEIFLDEYSRRCKRGFIVCRVQRARQLSERITAIPWNEM
ncbi:MAG: ATP-binding protein [Victivallales bacterium]|jgi:predicted AAA+ superfamily ATPase